MWESSIKKVFLRWPHQYHHRRTLFCVCGYTGNVVFMAIVIQSSLSDLKSILEEGSWAGKWTPLSSWDNPLYKCFVKVNSTSDHTLLLPDTAGTPYLPVKQKIGHVIYQRIIDFITVTFSMSQDWTRLQYLYGMPLLEAWGEASGSSPLCL